MRRRRPSILLAGTIAVIASVLLVSASSTHLTPLPQQVALLSGGPQAPAQPVPQVNLATLAGRATSDAERRGADISITVLDRKTGRLFSSGDPAPFPIASVAKLFIADDVLMRVAKGQLRLNPDERRGFDRMLRSSDDFAANEFWIRGGGNAVITRVAARYGLASTTPPYDGNWWTTLSTTADLVRFYDKLLDGTGGLPPEQASLILADLAASTPVGVDGYPQRFGIPDGLFAEPVAVKQGWMCCWNGPNQLHLSTGVVGADRRYVIAIASMQPVDEATARSTVTQALKTMFPGGRI